MSNGDKALLGLFGESDTPDVVTAYYEYQKGLDFNNQINLEDTVRSNQNFVIGKQWEGVKANGLPTPVFNVLKRVTGFIVSTITTDNVKVNVTALASSPETDSLNDPVKVVSEEMEALNELNDLPSLSREFARNAAIDGDGCIYTYWDDTVDCGNGIKGAIKDEIIDNTRVFFGNPNDRHVQTQPFIIISSREPVRSVRKRAKNNGNNDWSSIAPDTDESSAVDEVKYVDNNVTVLLTLYKDEETGEVWAFESTKDNIVRKPWNLGIRLYPIVWLCWDNIKDSYHGQAMITGLIPNQIFINKAWAMTMVSIMRESFPKVLFDKTRIKQWDNRVGGAIGINGGDVNSVAKILEPGHIDPQVSGWIQAAVEQTEQSLGATSVALGDTRPDNTSAIIALQKAAATPSETTKQNLYKAIEEHARIYLEFMAEYYGVRSVDLPPTADVIETFQFAGQDVPSEVPTDFDFKQLKELPMMLKLDVGASSYFSEIASVQTLSNLLMQDKIDLIDFLERIPDTYIPARRALISKKKNDLLIAQQQMQMQQSGQPGASPSAAPQNMGEQPEIHGGGGYAALQRAINSGQNPRDFI